MLGYSIDGNPHFIDAAEKAYYAIFENEGTAQKPPVQQPNQQQTSPVPQQQQQRTQQTVTRNTGTQPQQPQASQQNSTKTATQPRQSSQQQQETQSAPPQPQPQSQPSQQQTATKNTTAQQQSNPSQTVSPAITSMNADTRKGLLGQIKARAGVLWNNGWDAFMDKNLETFYYTNQDIIKEHMANSGSTFEEAMRWAVKQDAVNYDRFLAAIRNKWEKDNNREALKNAGIRRKN